MVDTAGSFQTGAFSRLFPSASPLFEPCWSRVGARCPARKSLLCRSLAAAGEEEEKERSARKILFCDPPPTNPKSQSSPSQSTRRRRPLPPPPPPAHHRLWGEAEEIPFTTTTFPSLLIYPIDSCRLLHQARVRRGGAYLSIASFFGSLRLRPDSPPSCPPRPSSPPHPHREVWQGSATRG